MEVGVPLLKMNSDLVKFVFLAWNASELIKDPVNCEGL